MHVFSKAKVRLSKEDQVVGIAKLPGIAVIVISKRKPDFGVAIAVRPRLVGSKQLANIGSDPPGITLRYFLQVIRVRDDDSVLAV